jgi:hypothetical protein
MDLTEPDEHGEDIFHPEPVPRRRTSAARAMAVIAIALVVAALLDADGLRQTADRQPPGRTRDMAVWVTKHVVQPVSHAFGFNQPRHWINDALGVRDNTHITNTRNVRLAPRTTRPPVPTTTTTIPRRRPSPTDPLRVLVTGDSLSENLFPTLVQALDGKPATVQQDSEIGTGLARPDVVDWPTKLAHDMAEGRYDVVVVMFGGNDTQDLRTATGWVHLGNSHAPNKEWIDEYERRIALTLDTLIHGNPEVTVVWVGLPAMSGGPATLAPMVPLLNSLIVREVQARPANAVYAPAGTILDTPQGGFQRYVTNADGSTTELRAGDGVHFSIAGGKRIVERLVTPIIERQYHLGTTPPPPPGPSRRSGPTPGQGSAVPPGPGDH